MYSLKQAAILAYKHLVQRLETHRYVPIPISNGLWKHKFKIILFILFVDNFGAKSKSQEDSDHWTDVLKQYYKLVVDLAGAKFCGLKLE